MATTESLEGSAGLLWFHYDLRNDVLYLRVSSKRDVESHGEETPDGVVLMRSIADDSVVGMTVVNWWKRFGQGVLPDSMNQIVAKIEPWAGRVSVAA